MSRFYFHTTGIVTKVFPTAAQLNAASTTTTTTNPANAAATAAAYAASAWDEGDVVRLIAVNVLHVPAAADTLQILAKDAVAGTRAMVITVPAASDYTQLITPKGGIPLPPGGFAVTTSQASSVYQFVFERQSATFVGSTRLDVPFVGTWAEATVTLTVDATAAAAFAIYPNTKPRTVTIISGTGATVGTYQVSAIIAGVIVLATSIGAPADAQTDIVGYATFMV